MKNRIAFAAVILSIAMPGYCLTYNNTSVGAVFSEETKGFASFGIELSNNIHISSKSYVGEEKLVDGMVAIHKKNYFWRTPYSTRFGVGVYGGSDLVSKFLPTAAIGARVSLDGYRSYVELETQAYSPDEGGDVQGLISLNLVSRTPMSRKINIKIGVEYTTKSEGVGISIGMSM